MLPKERGGGRFLTRRDIGKPNVVISTKIAARLPQRRRLSQGRGSEDADRPQRVHGRGDLQDRLGADRRDVVMEIKHGARASGRERTTVSTFDVEPVNVADSDALAERIGRPCPACTAQRIAQFNLTVGAIMGKLDLFLLLAVGLAVLVGAVGIANTMLMSTSERYVEFGVMRTNGWTRRNILALVTVESAALLGVLSGALGRGAGDRGHRRGEPVSSRFHARPEPLADGRQPRPARSGDRDALGPLPRLAGVADDPDGRDPAQM